MTTGSFRAGAFTLGDGALQVELWRDPTYTPGSADNLHRYDREIRLSDERGQATGVEVRVGGKVASTAVLLCDTGCPGITESRAILRGETLLVCVKDHVAALALPSLEGRWTTDLRDACVFGLMEIGDDDAVLVHGEIAITRLGMDGRIQWQDSGADIFTGGCHVEDGVVVAEDWNGAVYRWRLSDGATL